MKTQEIQIKIFKAMLKDQRVSYGELDENRVYVSTDGVTAYVLNRCDVMFDLSKCRIFNGLKLFDESEYHPLRMGENLKITSDGRFMLRELVGDFGSVYIENKRFNDFTLPEIYGKSPTDAVLIKEYGRVAGIIMPIKYNPDTAR